LALTRVKHKPNLFPFLKNSHLKNLQNLLT